MTLGLFSQETANLTPIILNLGDSSSHLNETTYYLIKICDANASNCVGFASNNSIISLTGIDSNSYVISAKKCQILNGEPNCEPWSSPLQSNIQSGATNLDQLSSFGFYLDTGLYNLSEQAYALYKAKEANIQSCLSQFSSQMQTYEVDTANAELNHLSVLTSLDPGILFLNAPALMQYDLGVTLSTAPTTTRLGLVNSDAVPAPPSPKKTYTVRVMHMNKTGNNPRNFFGHSVLEIYDSADLKNPSAHPKPLAYISYGVDGPASEKQTKKLWQGSMKMASYEIEMTEAQMQEFVSWSNEQGYNSIRPSKPDFIVQLELEKAFQEFKTACAIGFYDFSKFKQAQMILGGVSPLDQFKKNHPQFISVSDADFENAMNYVKATERSSPKPYDVLQHNCSDAVLSSVQQLKVLSTPKEVSPTVETGTVKKPSLLNKLSKWWVSFRPRSPGYVFSQVAKKSTLTGALATPEVRSIKGIKLANTNFANYAACRASFNTQDQMLTQILNKIDQSLTDRFMFYQTLGTAQSSL